jgi:hypothetical protein
LDRNDQLGLLELRLLARPLHKFRPGSLSQTCWHRGILGQGTDEPLISLEGSSKAMIERSTISQPGGKALDIQGSTFGPGARRAPSVSDQWPDWIMAGRAHDGGRHPARYCD